MIARVLWWLAWRMMLAGRSLMIFAGRLRVVGAMDGVWRCPDCGPGIAVDEDGCCATCGRDCTWEMPGAGA